MTHSTRVSRLSFYVTPPHECSYLDDRDAATLFADPRFPKSNALYATLSERGFRRSGEHLYQPHCPGCNACVPIRVPVAEFQPRRQQRRTWRDNLDLKVEIKPPVFDDSHFELYRRYIAARHPGGGMDDPTPDSYMNFLTATWADTIFIEFRQHGELLAVAVADRMPRALSAVYTFFDPASSARSLGRYAVLYEISLAHETGRQWLYLGYWIDECQKMRYKTEYQPLEYYRDGEWWCDTGQSPGRS